MKQNKHNDILMALLSIYKTDFFQNQLSRGVFEKGPLKNLAIFTGKHLFWSAFLIKLEVCRFLTLLIRNSNTGFFQ